MRKKWPGKTLVFPFPADAIQSYNYLAMHKRCISSFFGVKAAYCFANWSCWTKITEVPGSFFLLLLLLISLRNFLYLKGLHLDRLAGQANDTVWTEKIVRSAKNKYSFPISPCFTLCKVLIYTLASMVIWFFHPTIHFLHHTILNTKSDTLYTIRNIKLSVSIAW